MGGERLRFQDDPICMIYKYVKKKKPEWQRWFAWKPVPIGGWPARDNATMVWLQWIERKWLDSREGSSRYDYRLPGEKSPSLK